MLEGKRTVDGGQEWRLSKREARAHGSGPERCTNGSQPE